MLADGLELVVGVDVNEEGVVGGGDSGGGGGRVCFDVEARGLETPKDVVKRVVLHHYHHHDQIFSTQHSIYNSRTKREFGIEKS